MARNTLFAIFAPFAWLAFFFVPLFIPLAPAYAEHSCSVSPFSKTIKQGESVLYTVNLSQHSSSTGYSLHLGDLPKQVTSGFVVPSSSTSTQTSVVFTTGDHSQTGSLGLSLIYEIKFGTTSEETYCQLNLIIEEKQSTASGATSAGSGISSIDTGSDADTASSSPDALIDIPTDLLASINARLMKNASTSDAASTLSFTFSDANYPKFEKRLAFGSRGESVESLQDTLKDLGFFPEETPSTGYFGSITQKAVMNFQKSKGIEQVGIVGPKTRAALNGIAAQ